jgi:hypothetical protein
MTRAASATLRLGVIRRRGLTPHALVRRLLAVIIRDDLYDAVLDDELGRAGNGHDVRQPRSLGAAASRGPRPLRCRWRWRRNSDAVSLARRSLDG